MEVAFTKKRSVMKTDRFFAGMNPFGGICWLRIRKISEVLSRLKSNVGIVKENKI